MSFQAMPHRAPVRHLNEMSSGDLVRVLRVPSDLEPELQPGDVLRCVHGDDESTLVQRMDGSRIRISSPTGSAVTVRPF